jgi:uncharacterized protein (DUF433 family)
MSAAIIDRGRGPEIEGTRITVYDVLYKLEWNRTPSEIATDYQLTPDELQAALDYIDAHRQEVEAEWQKIKARIARGNPPELQARLDAIHAEMAPIWAEMRRKKAMRNGDEGDSGGH